MKNIAQQLAMKALIVKNDKVLVLREAPTYGQGTNRGKYHLPGGRVEKGEKLEEALKREVLEETGLKIEIKHPVYVGEWRPIIKGQQHQIMGVFVYCRPLTNKIRLSTEHDKYAWIEPNNHSDYKILSPDYLAIDCLDDGQTETTK